MHEAVLDSLEAIKIATQAIMLQDSTQPWGVVGETQLLW